MGDLVLYNFGKDKKLTVLDLGCGDGAITMILAARYPQNTYWLLDGSQKMLELARESLHGYDCYFTLLTFEEYIDAQDHEQKYDFVFSSNAIHHLDLTGKTALYFKVYRELTPRGLFMNVDVVQPRSELTEDWQFRMWVDWINEMLRAKAFGDDIHKYDNLAAGYKAAAENKPDRLYDQIKLLESAGFRDVACFYKYSIFSVFGGAK